GDGRHHLARNFRSAPAMLEAVEALFTVADDPARTFLEDGIVFEPVQPGGGVGDGALQKDGRPLKPLTFWTTPGGGARADDVRALMAQTCARTVADLLQTATLDGQPLRPAGIAVLVGTNLEGR